MKNYIGLLIMSTFAGLIFLSCGSDDSNTEPTNQSPVCSVTLPAEFSGFYSGDTILVKVSANDPDGDIKEVRFYLDTIGVASVQVFPYDAQIFTNNLVAGSHEIKIVAEDDLGSETVINFKFGIKPFSPSNLQLTQNNISTFTLNWTDNSNDEQGFSIERKIDESDFSELAVTTSTSYVDSTISKKGYGSVFYRVKSYADIYNSDYASNSYEIYFPAPYNINFTKIDISKIQLSWFESSVGEDGFKIDKKLSDSDWIIAYGSVGENTTTWLDTDAQINDSITYRVYGYKGNNTSDSIITSAIDNSLPPPTSISFTQNNLFSINISWLDNSIGEEKFEIERKLSAETDYVKIAEVNGSDTSIKSFTDSGVLLNNLYNYRIRSVAGDFNSSYTVKTFFNEFKSPSNLKLTQNNIYTITLNWNDNSIGEEGYIIEKKIDNGEWISNYHTLGENVTSWTDTNLLSNVNYTYRVCAYYREFLSNYSSEVSILPIYDVIITEVMFNPAADENQDEFIEIYNNSDVTINLSGWAIADNVETDLLIKSHGFTDMLLKPFSYCVVMDSSYYLNSTEYEDLIPDSVLRVMINDGSIGQYGLSNSYNETVKLFKPGSILTDSVTYDYTITEGYTWERKSNIETSWQKSKILRGTPGFENSISSKNKFK